jgi:hypothetical protein
MTKTVLVILDGIGYEMAEKNNSRQILGEEQMIMLQVKQHGTIRKVRGVTTQLDSTLWSNNALIRRGHC